jgi:uncharacterized small protein (DUF1192 family)
MSRKLVDPVHFFDAKGRSILRAEELEKRNAQLEAEVARLKRLVEVQSRRLQATGTEEEQATRH